FDKVCSCKTIYLDENPIAGTVGRGRNYVYAYPEFSCDWMADESNYATYRGAVGFREEERGLINQTVDYWRDRCEEAISRRMYDSLHPGEPDAATMFPGYPTLATTVAAFAYRFSMPDYYTILNKGLNWLIAVAEEKLSKVVVWDLGNLEARSKYDFYRAVILSLKAVIKLAQRYASMAREKAEVEADPERRLELLRMAEACEWVPANPARNFFEAVQSVWFIMLTSLIEEEGCGVQPWRFSQFMYPFYKKDVDEGRITREQAIELLEFFFLKIKETYFMTPVVGLAANGGQTSKYFSLGGLTADGKDATNEIDYLILETQRRLRLPEPAITVFYHDKMPEDFLHECVKLIRTGIGQPQFKNNDVAVQRELYHQQCSLEEAREVSTVYCVSVALPKSSAVCFGGPFNLAKVIELTLNNGRNPGDGIQMGPKTGEVESFTSWDKFYAAFREQLSYLMLRHREYNLIELNTVAELYPVPFRSAVHNDCLERGLSLDAGGAKYYTGGPLFTAGIDAANSLTAIKKLVYEEKKITLKKLKEALDANFEGYEEIQRMCLDAPKYGNDDDYGDKMARQVWDLVYDVYKGSPLDHNRKGSRPEPYSIALHNFFGYITGALPTGRKAGTALTDASVSPMPGTDLNGPTALAKSAAGAMDTVKYGTSHLNMRFHPSALEGEKGARALISLIKTYMQMGGDHIQFNCISTETLRDAQVHSENYADLVVRVAGFSAFYVHLDKGIQDEIIKRTELGFG
ncbi:MAG: hypothetical protein FJ004_01385, partial [Chloroflexi bacterium]|nr:hypothetical protein [Chloroflexota bacterium]